MKPFKTNELLLLWKIGYNVLWLKDEFRSVTVLLQNIVDVGLHREIMNVTDGFFGDHSRSKWTKVVHCFAQQELSAVAPALLPVSGGKIIGNCIAENTIFSLVIVQALTPFANDYC